MIFSSAGEVESKEALCLWPNCRETKFQSFLFEKENGGVLSYPIRFQKIQNSRHSSWRKRMEASYPVDRDTAIKSSKRWLSFQTQNNKKVIIVQSNQMVDCQEQRRRMRATLAGKYVHIRRMERDHKTVFFFKPHCPLSTRSTTTSTTSPILLPITLADSLGLRWPGDR